MKTLDYFIIIILSILITLFISYHLSLLNSVDLKNNINDYNYYDDLSLKDKSLVDDLVIEYQSLKEQIK
ncbi:hypothetical protein AVANS14531_04910 [Campylobacter sp. Cr9]|uniref:hypothetical protein n=1 Tax=Campylobacter sp. Cr9 TaxID=2735728 RepID=UPI003015536C|nr:hypothetical protein [Campylobacter sp. Cr9]